MERRSPAQTTSVALDTCSRAALQGPHGNARNQISGAMSLAQQLQRIRRTQRALGAAEAAPKHRASLLFDPREAADLDRETVFRLGRSGLDELERLDITFGRFALNLFSEESIQGDRAFLNKKENRAVDELVRSFLHLLAPFWEREEAHRALEWAIRRFRINEMNVDELLTGILPYHDTVLFVRLVQIAATENDDRWSFLDLVKQEAAPLQRPAIVQRCLVDPSILDRLFAVLRTHMERPADAPKPDRCLSFFTFATVEYVHRLQSVTGNHLLRLLPFVDVLLSRRAVGRWPAVLTSGVMLGAVLLERAPLSDEAASLVMLRMVRAADTVHRPRVAIEAIAAACESGPLERLQPDFVQQLLSLPGPQEAVLRVAGERKEALFFRLLAKAVQGVQALEAFGANLGTARRHGPGSGNSALAPQKRRRRQRTGARTVCE